jgi:hypothetical protein
MEKIYEEDHVTVTLKVTGEIERKSKVKIDVRYMGVGDALPIVKYFFKRYFFKKNLIRYFFSSYAYKKYLQLKVKAYNDSKYKIYNHMLYPTRDRLVNFHRPHEMVEARRRPGVIANFKEVPPNYKGTRKITPRTLETFTGPHPPNVFGIKGVMSPVHVVIQRLPFIENENRKIREFLDFLTGHLLQNEGGINLAADIGGMNLLKLKSYCEHLIEWPYRTRSKLDYILEFLHKANIDLATIEKLQTYLLEDTVIEAESKSYKNAPVKTDSLYLIRQSGFLTHRIYFFRFPKIVNFACTRQGQFFFLDCRKRNLYYYIIRRGGEKRHQKMPLVAELRETPIKFYPYRDRIFEFSQIPVKPENLMEREEEKKKPKEVITMHIYERKLFLYERHPINFFMATGQDLQAPIARVKGVLIINFYIYF